MRIGIDLDGICADLMSYWLCEINKAENTNFDIGHLIAWETHEALGLSEEQVYYHIEKPGVFNNLMPIPGAIDAVKILNEHHEIFILTAQPRHPQCAADKLEWVGKHLPFLQKKQITLTHRKDLFALDLLIDDSPATAARCAFPVWTIEYPYSSFAHHTSFLSWQNPQRAWEQMVRRLTN